MKEDAAAGGTGWDVLVFDIRDLANASASLGTGAE